MERVADQCADICDIIQAGEIPAQSSVVNHVVQMLETAGAMFEKAMDAFIARDVELARQVCGMDDQVDAMFSKIVLEVCGTITENPQSVMKEVDLMFITKYIERMGGPRHQYRGMGGLYGNRRSSGFERWKDLEA